MPTTEIQRIALLVALGVVGYLLMLAWNEDYGRGTAPGTPVQAPTVVDGPTVADPQEAAVPRGATDPVPGTGNQSYCIVVSRHVFLLDVR